MVNNYRITIQKWRLEEGLEDEEDFTARLGEIVADSVCPALCSEGCQVEPDGRCSHECPSLLLAMGLI